MCVIVIKTLSHTDLLTFHFLSHHSILFVVVYKLALAIVHKLYLDYLYFDGKIELSFNLTILFIS